MAGGVDCSDGPCRRRGLGSHGGNDVVTKYANGRANLENLKIMGAIILHRVDAREMMFHTDMKMQKFDRIVYNFPHAGFRGKEHHFQMISLHRQLLDGFFYNASHLLCKYGEVHVSHKIGNPYDKWNIEELASWNSLVLVECAAFNINDYPGYNNKRGDGVNCDEPFYLGVCSTYRFAIGKMKAAIPRMGGVEFQANRPVRYCTSYRQTACSSTHGYHTQMNNQDRYKTSHHQSSHSTYDSHAGCLNHQDRYGTLHRQTWREKNHDRYETLHRQTWREKNHDRYETLHRQMGPSTYHRHAGWENRYEAPHRPGTIL